MTADIRIYHGDPQSALTAEQAIHYLVTGELPEAVLLAGADPDNLASYRAADAETQLKWRHSHGALQVSNGIYVRHDPQPLSNRFKAFTLWEPIPGQGVEVYSHGEIEISTGGRSRDLTTSLGMFEAMQVALEIGFAARIRKAAVLTA